MEGKFDEVKGKAKQAAGDLTDNSDLRREGKGDEAAGKLKQKVEDAKDWVEDKIDGTRS
ncbi:MAG: CsbD family protein [Acidimicrobiia bacterium]